MTLAIKCVYNLQPFCNLVLVIGLHWHYTK